MKRLLLLAFLCYSCALDAQDIPPDFIPPADQVDSMITDFSVAFREPSRVFLTWKIIDEKVVQCYTVERSTNGKTFEVIAVVTLSSDVKPEWTDEAARGGRNFYRLKITTHDGRQYYSKTLAVTRSSIDFRFYPNPVDNLLLIRTGGPLDVQIIDATGRPRIYQNNVTGIHAVNVSKLEKGIYIIRFTNRANNSTVQEELIKN